MTGLGGPFKPKKATTLGGLFEPAKATTLGGLAQVATRMAVWEKGQPVLGYDPSDYRKDDYGFWIRYSEYGNQDSEYGWEIDHIKAKALGGSDELSNLRPLHHRMNASLGGRISGLFR